MADCCPKFLPDHSHSNTILSGGKTVETSQTGTNFKGRYKTEEGLDEKNQTKATTQSGTAGSSSTKTGESNSLKDTTGATTRTQKSGIRTDKEERGGAVNLKASTGGGDNDETVFEDESAVVTFKVIVKGFLATTQSICPAE